MRRLLLSALLLFAICSPSLAQDLTIEGQGTATISWVNATQYADGSALDPADITSVIIFYGPTPRGECAPPASATDASCYPLATEVTADGATSVGITLFLDQSTTFYFAGVTNVSGSFSRYSGEVPITLTLETDGPPLPPTGITIEIQVTCETNNAEVTCRFDVT